MATQKTANDYRAERKERLAKAAKQNSKKSHRITGKALSRKTKATIGIVVGVAVVLIIVGLACWGSGVFDRMKTIKAADGTSYSATEYEYYYRRVFNYYYNTAYQYDSYYGEGYGVQATGFDYKTRPEDQQCPTADFTNEDGSTPTWKDAFQHMALDQLATSVAVSELAKKDGYKLSESGKQDVKDQLEELKNNLIQSAEQNNSNPVSLGKYVKSYYGRGISVAKFTELLERDTLLTEYADHYAEKTVDGYSEDEIKAIYEKSPSDYEVIDMRAFPFVSDVEELAEDATDEEKEAATEKANKEAKSKADKMYKEVTLDNFNKLAEKYATDDQKESFDFTDENATLAQCILKADNTTFDEETNEWLYSHDRKAGDKKLVDVSDTYYVIVIAKPAYLDKTHPADVRHILYKFDTEAEDAEANKKECKANAEAALKAINDADDKLGKFIEICTAESEDTGSAENGGLLEKVGRGKYVKPFEEWALAEHKEGDTGIIESTYGYHVMYYVKSYDMEAWYLSIAENKAAEDYETMVNELIESDKYKISEETVAPLSEKYYKSIVSKFYSDAQTAA